VRITKAGYAKSQVKQHWKKKHQDKVLKLGSQSNNTSFHQPTSESFQCIMLAKPTVKIGEFPQRIQSEVDNLLHYSLYYSSQ